MILKPMIVHKCRIISNIPTFQKQKIKDTDKINTIIKLCKEMGIEVHTFEDAQKPITKMIIYVPYKEVML